MELLQGPERSCREVTTLDALDALDDARRGMSRVHWPHQKVASRAAAFLHHFTMAAFTPHTRPHIEVLSHGTAERSTNRRPR
jgi:hypothetical protein